MPPRFVYWTILIDGKPTAFRAREKAELLPTVAQLKRTNQDVVIKWFARAKLWDSPEAELAAQYAPVRPPEKRNRDWRPGGAHKDPRDRFKKKNRPERAWSEEERDRDQARRPKPSGPPQGDRRPWSKPSGPPRGDRKPWQNKPSGPAHNDRPWQTKPTGPRADRKPWNPKLSGPPRGDRRPWTPKPPSAGAPRGDRKPWQNKPSGPPRGDRKPWQGKPSGSARPPFRRDRPPFPKKKRDDDPDNS